MTKEVTTKKVAITADSEALFVAYAQDAGNWGGQPMVGGNVCLKGEREDRGNLTQLKKAGLVKTDKSDGCTWLMFTEAGVIYAARHGIDLTQADENMRVEFSEETKAKAKEILGDLEAESNDTLDSLEEVSKAATKEVNRPNGRFWSNNDNTLWIGVEKMDLFKQWLHSKIDYFRTSTGCQDLRNEYRDTLSKCGDYGFLPTESLIAIHFSIFLDEMFELTFQSF